MLAATSISQTFSSPRKQLDGHLISKQGAVTEQTLSSPLGDIVSWQHPAPTASDIQMIPFGQQGQSVQLGCISCISMPESSGRQARAT